jgi:hypothetical protein
VQKSSESLWRAVTTHTFINKLLSLSVNGAVVEQGLTEDEVFAECSSVNHMSKDDPSYLWVDTNGVVDNKFKAFESYHSHLL